eukprot:m.563595 g.563595  ORF g.563595 m.563595 type:complete len:423 (+) comp57813_c1_seq37:93-1361(+)
MATWRLVTCASAVARQTATRLSRQALSTLAPPQQPDEKMAAQPATRKPKYATDRVKQVLSFEQFMSMQQGQKAASKQPPPPVTEADLAPYLSAKSISGAGKSVFLEVYGCQMNFNDTEVAWSILQSAGYARATDPLAADVILLMTCAIRDAAERRVMQRLEELRAWRRKHKKFYKVGLLGCMAERLKTKLLEEDQLVDVVAGPDAYRDLPRMLAATDDGQAQINVLLSLDETYSDIAPVRLDADKPSAFISIMRGCDNMCSYCIVPFTRGRERSRPIQSILNEVQSLSQQGIKEVTLLGQNVNSFRDTSVLNFPMTQPTISEGFTQMTKLREGGMRFADLLHQVAEIDPEMRIRFTSPHPKDFPDEVDCAALDTLKGPFPYSLAAVLPSDSSCHAGSGRYQRASQHLQANPHPCAKRQFARS